MKNDVNTDIQQSIKVICFGLISTQELRNMGFGEEEERKSKEKIDYESSYVNTNLNSSLATKLSGMSSPNSRTGHVASNIAPNIPPQPIPAASETYKRISEQYVILKNANKKIQNQNQILQKQLM